MRKENCARNESTHPTDSRGPRSLVAAFAWHLSSVKDLAKLALEDDEVMGELAAREIKRADVVRLAESAKDVASGFYNDPGPR